VWPALVNLDRVTSRGSDHDDIELRVAIIEAFGKLGGDSVVPILSEALVESDWRIREAAARSLRQIKSDAARAALIEANYQTYR
jgi:HEAT repeat protein